MKALQQRSQTPLGSPCHCSTSRSSTAPQCPPLLLLKQTPARRGLRPASQHRAAAGMTTRRGRMVRLQAPLLGVRFHQHRRCHPTAAQGSARRRPASAAAPTLLRRTLARRRASGRPRRSHPCHCGHSPSRASRTRTTAPSPTARTRAMILWLRGRTVGQTRRKRRATWHSLCHRHRHRRRRMLEDTPIPFPHLCPRHHPRRQQHLTQRPPRLHPRPRATPPSRLRLTRSCSPRKRRACWLRPRAPRRRVSRVTRHRRRLLRPALAAPPPRHRLASRASRLSARLGRR